MIVKVIFFPCSGSDELQANKWWAYTSLSISLPSEVSLNMKIQASSRQMF